MASAEPSIAQANNAHVHLAGEVCPLCDQSIPADKLVEIQQRERLRAQRQEAKLRADFNKDKAAALAEKSAEIESIKQEAASKAAAELAESKKREDAARAVVVAEASKAAKIQLDKTEAEKKAADIQLKVQQDLAIKNAALVTSKDAEIESVRQEKVKALALEQAESKKREAALKVEAVSQAEAAVKAKLTQAEADKKNAEEKAKAIAEKAELEKKLAQELLESAKKESELLAEKNLKKELAEQREALEKASLTALQKEQSNEFAKRQKLEEQLAKVQRQLKDKTADELGEEAEFDLLDELKKNFKDDSYTPIAKGLAGADLLQDVIHKGTICGRIVYDSKNRDSWRNSYVDKLKTDQLNADGDHAVLTTRKFPAGVNQLHVQDGVVVSHPARVVAMVTMLREQIIATHRLNTSNNLREVKTEELYKFINSERCNQIFENFLTLTDKLFEIDVDEKKNHERTWKKRGELLTQAHRAIELQLRGEIDRIIVEDVAS